LERLEKEVPDLGEQVKRYYFSFEDMTKLPQDILSDVLKLEDFMEADFIE